MRIVFEFSGSMSEKKPAVKLQMNLQVEVQDFRRFTDHFRGIYKKISQIHMKAKPENVNM